MNVAFSLSCVTIHTFKMQSECKPNRVLRNAVMNLVQLQSVKKLYIRFLMSKVKSNSLSHIPFVKMGWHRTSPFVRTEPSGALVLWPGWPQIGCEQQSLPETQWCQGDTFWKRNSEKVTGKIMFFVKRTFLLGNLYKYTDLSRILRKGEGKWFLNDYFVLCSLCGKFNFGITNHCQLNSILRGRNWGSGN